MNDVKVKKITVATVKGFIRKNRENLMIRVKSQFDGMQDCVADCCNDNGFEKARERDRPMWYPTQGSEADKAENKQTLNIQGVYFVGGRDYCKAFENEYFKGYEVWNCCGNWFVAVAKEVLV